MRSWAAALVVVAACGGGGGGGGAPDAQAQDDAPAPPDAHGAACTTGLPIYLNRDGGAYTMGGTEDSTTNVSTLLTGPATISANTAISDDDWNALVACVADKFAPFAAVITDVDPGTEAHVEAVFPTQAEFAALGFGAGVTGVSPFNCMAIPDAIVFVDLSQFPAAKDRCELVGMMVGNAFGLDHELYAADLESYLTSSEDRTFVDMDEPCGEFDARNCCDGTATQNTFAKLTAALGPCP